MDPEGTAIHHPRRSKTSLGFRSLTLYISHIHTHMRASICKHYIFELIMSCCILISIDLNVIQYVHVGSFLLMYQWEYNLLVVIIST